MKFAAMQVRIPGVLTLLLALFVCLALPWRADSVVAQDKFEPVELTEDQLKRYITTLPQTVSMMASMKGKPVPELQVALRAVVSKNGFTDYAKFNAMSSTISMVMLGIDPVTREFKEPKYVMEDKIRELTQMIGDLKSELMSAPSNETSDAADAQLLPLTNVLDELKEDRGVMPDKTSAQNVKLIKKYFNQLVSAALPRKEVQ